MIFMLGGLWAACFSEEARLVSFYTLICASAKYIFISNNSKEEVGIRLPQSVRTAQKRSYVGILSSSGVAQRQRRHSCFCLDALMVVEMNISVDQIICFF